MSASSSVPKDISKLTTADWKTIFDQLEKGQRDKLKDLIENALKKKPKNAKKRRIADLDDEEVEEREQKNTNTHTSAEPPQKKSKASIASIEDICRDLTAQATKDGIKKIVVGGLILNDANEMLVLQRAQNEFMPNIYEIASGTKDAEDKTLIDCLGREIKEETGLSLVKTLHFIASFDYKSSSGKPTRQFSFCVTVESAEKVVISEEHQAFAWVKQSDLFEEENADNKYTDVVAKITPPVRDIMRKGFSTFTK